MRISPLCSFDSTEASGMTDKRPTNRGEAGPDLFQLVERFYRGHFESAGGREGFDRWLTSARPDLLEGAQYGADPAFLLHVLVCTRGRRLTLHADRLDAVRRLAPRKKALLIGALKLVGELGEPWLMEVFGPADPERPGRFLSEVMILAHLLTGGVVQTPAWSSAFGRPPRAHQRERAVTGAIVCLLEALQRHPKPAAAVVVLLEKFELLRGRTRGGQAAVAFVEARARRAQAQVRDPLSPVGNVIFHLRGTFTHLKEFLQASS